jgi:hypothetical protein
MRWRVNIEGKDNQRIIVTFDPKSETIAFIGQYKPHNQDWVDFSEIKHSMHINLQTIQELLGKVYDEMKIRLEAYENINEGFSVIKKIEIQDEE